MCTVKSFETGLLLFLKNTLKITNLSDDLSLTYGDKFRTNMKNATINHIIYKN